MEQELIELLLTAKRALSTGQHICAQANTISQESERHGQAIETTWPKILFANNHILVQISTLERIREFLSLKVDQVRGCIKDYEKTLGSLSMELEDIFAMLKRCQIDPGVLSMVSDAGGEGDENHANLFGYISDVDIQKLQQTADDEIGEVEILCSSLELVTRTLSKTISDLASAQETALSISLKESAADFAVEQAHLQEREIAKMADILTSLTNHYDQLGEAVRLCQSDPETSQSLDITVLREDHEHIPDILDDLEESISAVTAVNDEIKVRLQVYKSVQGELLKVLTQLSHAGSPGGQVDTILERTGNAEGGVKDHELCLQDCFAQLSSLVEWYRAYASSYSHLILEIERRRLVVERQEKMREELARSFMEAYETEQHERQTWFMKHGEYLPEALCGFILDAPAKLSVEMTQSKLPNLSQENVKKAQVDINQGYQPTTRPV